MGRMLPEAETNRQIESVSKFFAAFVQRIKIAELRRHWKRE